MLPKSHTYRLQIYILRREELRALITQHKNPPHATHALAEQVSVPLSTYNITTFSTNPLIQLLSSSTSRYRHPQKIPAQLTQRITMHAQMRPKGLASRLLLRRKQNEAKLDATTTT